MIIPLTFVQMYMQNDAHQYRVVSLIQSDLKGLFSIAITPRCREGATPFPGLLHFTL